MKFLRLQNTSGEFFLIEAVSGSDSDTILTVRGEKVRVLDCYGMVETLIAEVCGVTSFYLD